MWELIRSGAHALVDFAARRSKLFLISAAGAIVSSVYASTAESDFATGDVVTPTRVMYTLGGLTVTGIVYINITRIRRLLKNTIDRSFGRPTEEELRASAEAAQLLIARNLALAVNQNQGIAASQEQVRTSVNALVARTDNNEHQQGRVAELAAQNTALTAQNIQLIDQNRQLAAALAASQAALAQSQRAYAEVNAALAGSAAAYQQAEERATQAMTRLNQVEHQLSQNKSANAELQAAMTGITAAYHQARAAAHAAAAASSPTAAQGKSLLA